MGKFFHAVAFVRNQTFELIQTEYTTTKVLGRASTGSCQGNMTSVTVLKESWSKGEDEELREPV